jgi:multimeric flavodoxin WrbA
MRIKLLEIVDHLPETKVLVLNGSPHRGMGATGSLLSFFIQGMESEEANVDVLNVYDLEVKPCRGCLACWHTSPGKCIQEDDMQKVLPEIADSDILVLATPVYVDGMTGSMKTLLDRIIPLIEGRFEVRDDHCRHPLRAGVTQGEVVLVSVCGFTEMDNFEPLVTHVKAICKNLSKDYAGALLRPYGWAFRELKRMGYPIAKVYEACREAGIQMIRNGSIPEKVLKDVSRSLISQDEIVSAYNKQYE